MAAGVVGDDAVPAPLQHAGAHHDVAARGSEAVQKDHRRSLPALLAGERHTPVRDLEWDGLARQRATRLGRSGQDA